MTYQGVCQPEELLVMGPIRTEHRAGGALSRLPASAREGILLPHPHASAALLVQYQ